MRTLLLTSLLPLFVVGCARSDNDALFEAILSKNTEEVERILSEGNVTLEPPRQPALNNKPLAYAAAFGNLESVKLILEKGADIDGQVAYDDVPLIKAAEHDNKDIIQYLIEQGADVNIPNAFGMSPFIGFCGGDDVELVQLAITHGGKINEGYPQQVKPHVGRENSTALQVSVFYGKLEIVQLLLANGGDPSLKDAAGKACLDLAREKGHEIIVELLNEFAANQAAGSAD